MKEVKLFKLLKTLDKAEFSRLSKFLRSPFFNLTPSFIDYFEAIKRYYPDFPNDKIKATKIWSKVFPDHSFQEVKFWRLSSDFHKLVKRYITALELEKRPQESQQLFIKAMNDRGNYSLFEKETKQYLENLEKQPFRDWEYHSRTYELNFDYYFHSLTQKHTLKDEALEQLMESVDLQFVLAKYRIGSEMKNRERMLAKQYPIRFLESIEAASKNGFGKENILLQHYRLLFEMYEPEKAANAFEGLKKMYSENVQNFRRFDQSLFLTQLINYTIGQIRKGIDRFYKEALDLYQIGLKLELVIENKQLNEAVFGNIVLLGCHAREFDWTDQFIEAYQNYLKEEIRIDAVALNRGLWYFHQGDFDNAYDLLINHSFSYYYQPKARTNMIINLMERFLKDSSLFDLLISQIEAFEKFIQRSKLFSAQNKEARLNWTSITKKIATGVYGKKNQKKLQSTLIKQIEEKNPLIAKKWLIQKVNQITH